MTTEKITTYFENDLEKGICPSCGEETTEIFKDDGRCVDCIEAENFYEETMKGV